MVAEHHERDRQAGLGRVVAGEQEVDDHGDQFVVVQAVAAVLGLHEGGEKVVAGLAVALLDQLAHVLVEPYESILDGDDLSGCKAGEKD